MRISRFFTKGLESPYQNTKMVQREALIKGADGVIFHQEVVEVPENWSQRAVDILSQKYMRKAGVPKETQPVKRKKEHVSVPDSLLPRVPVKDTEFGAETSAKQVFDRLAGCWAYWGAKSGYFESTDSAEAFRDEVAYMLCNQMGAPNSPQWFNTGLNWAYGISGPPQGHWYTNKKGEAVPSEDAYSRIAAHACFILDVQDSLTQDKGIIDTVASEAVIFKYGSGAGANFSRIRAEGEKLSGGGKSSGVMSFLRINDVSAGAIKSGGTTRRAAKMTQLDIDHPDVLEFINWKAVEENKVASLVTGSKVLVALQDELEELKKKGTEWDLQEAPIIEIVQRYTKLGVPPIQIKRYLQLGKQGKSLQLVKALDTSWEGEAYRTVSGQNSNNSVRVPNSFLKCLETKESWTLKNRADSGTKTVDATSLWDAIGLAAWETADPGLQYHDTINEWNTCPLDGEIRGSNPCFPADQRVLTNYGWLPIIVVVEMVEAGQPIEVATHNLTAESPEDSVSFSRPTKVFRNETRPILTVEFDDGSRIRLTENHKIWTSEGYKEAGDLELGDTLPKVTFKILTEIPQNLCEESHMIGWCIGDGGLYLYPDKSGNLTMGSQRWVYAKEDQEIYLRHKRFLTEKGVIFNEYVMENGTNQIVLHNVGEVRKLVNEGWSLSSSYTGEGKRVPEGMFSASLQVKRDFLRGLYDSDGSVWESKNKTRAVALASKEKDLLRQVQLILLEFGIGSRIYRTKKEGQTLLPDGKGGQKHYKTETMWDLRISGLGMFQFKELIGFTLTRKVQELNEILDSFKKHPYETKKSNELKVVSTTLGLAEPTYTLEEPKNHSYIVEGKLVANCSEYQFLDDTACNLASVNLVAFMRPDGTLDTQAYRHAIRLWTIILDITVEMAHFPSPTVAINTYRYRTLGLGYANLGAYIMRSGYAYDSEQGYAICTALTALMHFISLNTSVELAQQLEAFPGFQKNRKEFQKVMWNHITAGRQALTRNHIRAQEQPNYKDLTVYPCVFSILDLEEDILVALDQELNSLEESVLEDKPFRNAQNTVLAPTGTISFVMDCDTTGIEPDYSLVKYKTLAGGGHMSYVNLSVKPALEKIGLSSSDINAVMKHLEEEQSLDFCSLLTPEQKKIFDCAVPNGTGTSCIHYKAHLKMMAAAQPFLSGAISKTINMPEWVTVDDIQEIYLEAHKLMIKCIAIYRDGSKLSQPLNSLLPQAVVDLTNDQNLNRGERRVLPSRRQGYTQKFQVGGQTIYMRTGEYENGELGEIFLDAASTGSTLSAMISNYAIAVSLGLQYGVPLEEFFEAFQGSRFEPHGLVRGHESIKLATSILDAIVRDLAIHYKGREDLKTRNATGKSKTVKLETPSKKYAGESCPKCKKFTMVRNGTCFTCTECGETSGCG